MSMDPTHIPSSEASNSEPILRRNSDDVGWEYEVIVDVKTKDCLRCILCGNQYNGGVTRMKKHIAQVKGDVAACTKASKEDILKCKKALNETAAKKKEKKQGGINLRGEVNIVHGEGDEFEDDEVEHVGSRKRAHDLGPLDRYTEINPGSSDTTTSGFKKVKQPNIKDAIWKKRSHEVSQYLARWVYEAGIPFHAVDNDNAWTDRKRRSIMNLCVNYKQGTCFLSSKEDSETSHTGVYIFEYVDKFIEDIGPQNVVQVVTDNASNNMAAADLLKIKRPNIFWTSCGIHTINLMLEGSIKGAYKQVETNYRPILDVIDGKAKGQLDSALHLTGYFLNSFYFYKDHTIQDDPIIMDGVLTCVEAFFPDDVNIQDEVINRELLKHNNKEGGFGRPLATMGCVTNNDSYDLDGCKKKGLMVSSFLEDLVATSESFSMFKKIGEMSNLQGRKKRRLGMN
ncbi:hypothetical protein RHSIM_Rhsim06G0070600 [Rhododendron simsii]|uniref:DUF659 domain-containing protein n=1 Tax=Rhododendron simsii TaxID=118357 RepID=A0A834GR02_RHOSS|nr:hypothetical protein RHSIM_Rhsim06G0070600 [Rhododendron simsii]